MHKIKLSDVFKGAGSTSSNTNTKDKFEAVADNISFNEEQVPCNRVRKCIRLSKRLASAA